MNYKLNNPENKEQKASAWSALKRLRAPLKGEYGNIAVAFVAILLNSGANLLAPVIIAHTIDTSIQHGDFHGVLVSAGILLGVYAVALVAAYAQTMVMGGVGRRTLFKLRNDIFNKLQSLPVAFFNQNKVGDLISRINNDTDKLSQFFTQALMQFVGNFFMMLGAAILLLSLNIRLGAAALAPALGVVILTQVLSSWVKRQNKESLQSLGGMSAEIQESLNNFKVIVAFNRLDYFRQKFNGANQKNYTASVKTGLANGIFIPIYGLANSLAQLAVLAFGVLMISSGNLTVGLLVGFFLYVNNFYQPLRQIASIWSMFQQAFAALERISEVMDMMPNLAVIPAEQKSADTIMEFHNVHFAYPDGKEVLKGISFRMERGKTYALVGPTGGGKTTTASLVARLYDPTEGTVSLAGKDIRSYEPVERAQKIGFILQEPFLFTGTVLDNIFYGNEAYAKASDAERIKAIEDAGLNGLLKHFESGLDTKVQSGGDSISLGQRQLIAFVRAVLRKPELLILDEATANIDTVTEQLLSEVLDKLPKETTKIVIAHRLNTIANADEIFFVNGGEVVAAGSLDHAVELLMHGKRSS
jgi:ATP-binding cassette subfamily B protein